MVCYDNVWYGVGGNDDGKRAPAPPPFYSVTGRTLMPMIRRSLSTLCTLTKLCTLTTFCSLTSLCSLTALTTLCTLLHCAHWIEHIVHIDYIVLIGTHWSIVVHIDYITHKAGWNLVHCCYYISLLPGWWNIVQNGDPLYADVNHRLDCGGHIWPNWVQFFAKNTWLICLVGEKNNFGFQN